MSPIAILAGVAWGLFAGGGFIYMWKRSLRDFQRRGFGRGEIEPHDWLLFSSVAGTGFLVAIIAQVVIEAN